MTIIQCRGSCPGPYEVDPSIARVYLDDVRDKYVVAAVEGNPGWVLRFVYPYVLEYDGLIREWVCGKVEIEWIG